MSSKIFEAVSFHIVKPCNMKCKFCYATFDDMHVQQMTKESALVCIKKLKDSGVKKITFAGGEPLLYKHLKICIRYSKSIGLTTSIITNGSLLNEIWLYEMMPHLDWIGLSIDSVDPNTLQSIGRVAYREVDYYNLIGLIKDMGYRLKINTVVNAYNWNENINDLISWANPDRWKVFQTLRVEGQNDKQFDEIKCTEQQFASFIYKHGCQKSLVPEDNEAMTGSYLLIDPQGRLFENSAGKHTYSQSIINNDFNECLSQINLNREMFVKRGGIYNW